jgi:hypothetical protein
MVSRIVLRQTRQCFLFAFSHPLSKQLKPHFSARHQGNIFTSFMSPILHALLDGACVLA